METDDLKYAQWFKIPLFTFFVKTVAVLEQLEMALLENLA